MASSSSYFSFAPESTREYNYDVFPSFSGQDVRKTFLSHFLEGLKTKGIHSFIDNGIRRSESINIELKKAIKESKIAVVILSKNYASSSWCLNELKLIMKCKAKLEQRVMTIFYDIDPSDVRKQTGDFGKMFKETCEEKTEEQREEWRQALSQVAGIAGEHSTSWASEAEMISKIIIDISNELPSTDFDELVGIEEHVSKLKSMVSLESDEVKIIGIWGPAGIDKTTIAKALYNQISCNFQLKFYKENVGDEYKRTLLDNINLQHRLRHELLSGVLDHRNLKIPNLVESQFRLMHQRVLLVLDDLKGAELEALKVQIQLLRFGSKVIVTSEDLYTLRRYEIDENHIYKVVLPSKKDGLKILSYSAFGQNSPPRSYLDLVLKLLKFIAPYPLGLKILGSSLRGKKLDEWTITIHELKSYLDIEGNDIEKVIRFVYDGLSDKHRSKFKSLACCIKYGRGNLNEYLFEDKDWDVENWIQRFVDLGFFFKSEDGGIKMHYLLMSQTWITSLV